MNEKVYRITIVVLITVVFLGGAGAGWLLTRSNRANTELALQARNHLSLLESYSAGITYLGERYRVSETGRIELDSRNRELEAEVSEFIRRLGDMDGDIFDIESAVGGAAVELRGDIGEVRDLAAEIREILKAVEGVQDSDVLLGGSTDLDDSADGGA